MLKFRDELTVIQEELAELVDSDCEAKCLPPHTMVDCWALSLEEKGRVRELLKRHGCPGIILERIGFTQCL